MIDFLAGDEMPDVLCNLGVVAGVPAWIGAADGHIWREMCETHISQKLDFRHVVDPTTNDTMFIIFEPPHIDAPILAVDESPMTQKLFHELLGNSGGAGGAGERLEAGIRTVQTAKPSLLAAVCTR